jgi:hypothetical protein
MTLQTLYGVLCVIDPFRERAREVIDQNQDRTTACRSMPVETNYLQRARFEGIAERKFLQPGMLMEDVIALIEPRLPGWQTSAVK